jgi:hypothetical protein
MNDSQKTNGTLSLRIQALALLATGAAVLSAPTQAHAAATREVTVPISDVYIPSGFDSSSDAFVVLNGVFPNTCYQWKESVVTHLTSTKHEIRSTAIVTPGMCIMVLVPFMHEAQIGKLEKGDHSLRFISGDGTYIEKHLVIE